MNLEFDINRVQLTEFGVGQDGDGTNIFAAVPVDVSVQGMLAEMVRSTWTAMREHTDSPAKYEPSEKYASTEFIYLPLEDGLADSVRVLHQAAQLDVENGVLDDPSAVFCYFARLTDNKKRRLTALRRAAQFKGVLKSRGRLLRLADDTLRVVDDNVFKLDSDFDILIDSKNVYILRASAFEFTGKLRGAILDAVPKNIEAMANELTFVDLTGIEKYASKHPRAARYVASIRGQAHVRGVDKCLLMKLCDRTGVEVCESNGKLTVGSGHELAFLEVLDRRRYELELVIDRPEQFKAASRIRLNNS